MNNTLEMLPQTLIRARMEVSPEVRLQRKEGDYKRYEDTVIEDMARRFGSEMLHSGQLKVEHAYRDGEALKSANEIAPYFQMFPIVYTLQAYVITPEQRDRLLEDVRRCETVHDCLVILHQYL